VLSLTGELLHHASDSQARLGPQLFQLHIQRDFAFGLDPQSSVEIHHLPEGPHSMQTMPHMHDQDGGGPWGLGQSVCGSRSQLVELLEERGAHF
jgi:hypothetical protein